MLPSLEEELEIVSDTVRLAGGLSGTYPDPWVHQAHRGMHRSPEGGHKHLELKVKSVFAARRNFSIVVVSRLLIDRECLRW